MRVLLPTPEPALQLTPRVGTNCGNNNFQLIISASTHVPIERTPEGGWSEHGAPVISGIANHLKLSPMGRTLYLHVCE